MVGFGMRWWCLALAFVGVAGCGGSQQGAVPETVTTSTKTSTVASSQGTPSEQDGSKIEPVLPAGERPISPSAFASFLGVDYGDQKTRVEELVPETAPGIGKRTPIEMYGSTGFQYPSHLAISWDTDSGRVDYISVRSDAARSYLAGRGRNDAKLTSIWGRTAAELLGILGRPTDVVERPHAVTYRYRFDAGGKVGAVTVELSKLSSPPKCSAVSVHWLHE